MVRVLELNVDVRKELRSWCPNEREAVSFMVRVYVLWKLATRCPFVSSFLLKPIRMDYRTQPPTSPQFPKPPNPFEWTMALLPRPRRRPPCHKRSTRRSSARAPIAKLPIRLAGSSLRPCVLALALLQRTLPLYGVHAQSLQGEEKRYKRRLHHPPSDLRDNCTS